MRLPANSQAVLSAPSKRSNEQGSAIVIALFVLALISVFVALALSRTSTEAIAVGNEAAESRTLYAAQGGLEVMTRNFNKIFERKLNPTALDKAKVVEPNFPGLSTTMGGIYSFEDPAPELIQTSESVPVVLTDKAYAGLYAIRDNWELKVTATDPNGAQVQLERNILNNRVPIFQFGIFYDDDLELFRPPRFSFGGRVHSNRHFFLSPGDEGVYFDSRVTAAGQIITESWRNGYQGDNYNKTYIKDASGDDQLLYRNQGSVLNGTPNIFTDPDLPASKLNPNWLSQSAKFDGNLQANVDPLNLPLKVGANTDLIEMIKRGKQAGSGGGGGDLMSSGVYTSADAIPVTTADEDNDILKSERFANKTGIRVSLADSKAKLPGCSAGSGMTAITDPCGIRLDGKFDGSGADPDLSATNLAERARGYRPPTMRNVAGGPLNAYVPTWVNGERLYTGVNQSDGSSKQQTWIKIETVKTDDATGDIITKDITADILALGVTEPVPSALSVSGYSFCAVNGTPTNSSTNQESLTDLTATTCVDSRSIIKLQRFAIPGSEIKNYDNTTSKYLTPVSGYNVVQRFTNATQTKINNGCPTTTSTPSSQRCADNDYDQNGNNGTSSSASNERYAHLKLLNSNSAIVPFPIEMFDTREGEHYDARSSTYYTDQRRLTNNGVMSMVDVDIANLRRFLRGDFDGLFPTNTYFAINNGGVGLTKADIPSRDGYVLYVSDRRGDYDFDGEFDMEDIYGANKGNDGIKQPGEDINFDGILNTRYGTEATKYNTDTVSPDYAAVVDHRYYRRGVRLTNGTVIPGVYDSVTSGNTQGFTVASENGVYVQGNYNATNVTSIPSTGNTPAENYRPNDALQVPAAIVADAVTILSNDWNDAKSFISPYDEGGRLVSNQTTIRFAMISGDTIASKEDTPNQGGISPRLNGGVHNFKRFLERWSGEYLNYSGSLINLYNSRNNNGSFKCCDTVYDPPYRNWVFDTSFLDPTRLPPGTPFFQYVQTTGFRRINN